MAIMRAVDAAVRILEVEGISCAFGVPGVAINPLYSALRNRGSINHILARHVKAASHMAEGHTRAKVGNTGMRVLGRRVDVTFGREALHQLGVNAADADVRRSL